MPISIKYFLLVIHLLIYIVLKLINVLALIWCECEQAALFLLDFFLLDFFLLEAL